MIKTKKRIISLFLAVIMLASVMCTGLTVFAAEAGTTLTFRNQNLTDVSLAAQLQTYDNLENVRVLKIENNPGITDISAIFDYLPNLTTLYADFCSITTFPNQQISDKLSTLYLPDNRLTDMSNLSVCFPNLKSLSIENNQITSLNALAGLSSLIYLYADNNQISSLKDFPFFPQLIKLTLSNNRFTDLSTLAGLNLSNLDDLYLNENNITDISALAEMDLSKLRRLYLNNNNITDLSALAGLDLSELYNLELDGNNITDISALAEAKFSNLDSLLLNNNNISDISPLDKLGIPLYACELRYNNITDVSAMQNFTTFKAQIFDISYNPLYSCIEELGAITVRADNFIYAPFSDNPNFDLNEADFDQTHLMNVKVDNQAHTIDVYAAPDVGSYFYLDVIGGRYNITLEPVTTPDGVVAIAGKKNHYSIRNVTGNNQVETTASVVYKTNSEPVEYTVKLYFTNDLEYLSPIYGTMDKNVVTQRTGYDYVGVRLNAGLINSGYKIDVALTEDIRQSGDILRVYPNGGESVETTFTVTDPKGSTTQYPLKFVFAKTEKPFDPSGLRYVNVKDAAYDSAAKALTINTESNTFVRIYKNAQNGVYLNVDLSKYDFVVDYGGFYQISKKDLDAADANIASFEIQANNGETIKAAVNFPGAGILDTAKLNMGNGIVSVGADKGIDMTIKSGKTYITLYKALTTGEVLSLTCDSRYVEERDNCYILRYQAVGEDITMSINNNSFAVRLAKAA